MYKENYEKWLEFVSPEDREIMLNMSEEEKIDSFSETLSFGTAGIRGIMGIGTNRLNIYNIGMIMKGYAEYLNNMNHNAAVVIGYDTRNNSYKFAMECALVLNAYGIRTYMFNDIASTPLVSYAVNYLNVEGGIVITSSHNSKIYNGYKIYNASGGQIVYPEDELILKEINNTDMFESVKRLLEI